MLIVPEGTAMAGIAVAWGIAVGAAAPPLDDGTAVAAATGAGVAVAEDPQANSSVTNKRTIALGRCRSG